VAAGHLLVRTGVATHEHGRFLFVFAFYVCMPAVVFDAVAGADLTGKVAVLPLAALLAVVGGYAAGWLVSRQMALPPPRLGVFLMACMIVNTGFAFPFIQAHLGAEGIARLVVFDVVNVALVLTWVYAIAVRSNPEQSGNRTLWRKLFASPPLYGFVAGLAANVAGLQAPETAQRLVDVFGAPTGFLLTVGIGMLLVVERAEIRVGMWAIATRLATSLLIGAAVIALFNLTGVERAVLLALCVAPVGFNTVTFASLENLDVRLATGTISLSLIAGLVLVPGVLLAVG
jgi:predicted permease